MNNVHGIIYAYHAFPELKTLGALRTDAAAGNLVSDLKKLISRKENENV